MDYFQGIVSEYLRANRTIFLNSEFCLQLEDVVKEPTKGTSWYIDFLAVSFGDKTVYLCEVSYAKTAAALLTRLKAWSQNWPKMMDAIRRDALVPTDWPVRPWLFVCEEGIEALVKKLPPLPLPPRITPLEMTLPWKYNNFNHPKENKKPTCIPPEMQV